MAANILRPFSQDQSQRLSLVCSHSDEIGLEYRPVQYMFDNVYDE
jgi:hypothetical protein